MGVFDKGWSEDKEEDNFGGEIVEKDNANEGVLHTIWRQSLGEEEKQIKSEI